MEEEADIAPLLLPLKSPAPTLTLRCPALPATRPAASTCGRSSFGRRQRRPTRLASRIPDTRAAARLRSAASASCAAQVDNSPNPLMFSQARAPRHTLRAPQIAHAHTRAPVPLCAVPSSPLHLGARAVVLALPDRRGQLVHPQRFLPPELFLSAKS